MFLAYCRGCSHSLISQDGTLLHETLICPTLLIKLKNASPRLMVHVVKAYISYTYRGMLHCDCYHTATGHTDVTFIAVPREIGVNYERVCRESCIARVYVYMCLARHC